MAHQKSFLEFEDICRSGIKTKEHRVWTKDRSELLGMVRWWTGWRRYCFFPENSRLFDAACLEEIRLHIVDLMAAHKLAHVLSRKD